MIKGKCCICGTVKNCGPFLEKICGPVCLKGKAGLVDCEHRSFHLMARSSY
jgi:hypothetical protein